MTIRTRLDRLQVLVQKDYTADERAELEKQGKAMKGGKFPIKTKGDLKNAIKDWGRSGEKASVRNFISKRAKAEGWTDLLPSDWPASTKDSGGDAKMSDSKTVKQSGSQLCPSCGVDMVTKDYAESTTPATMQQQSVIIQIDEIRGLLHAIVQSPDRPHLLKLDEEIIQVSYTPECVEGLCHDFLRDGLQGSVGVRHNEVTQAGIENQSGKYATVVENFCAPVCYDVEATHVPKGSWIQVYDITDPTTKEEVASGILRAPSLAAPRSATELELIEE